MSETKDKLIEKEAEEFFEHIENEDIKKINEILATKDKEIWKYRSEENEDSTVLHVSVYKKLYKITELIINYVKENNEAGLNDFINEKNKQGTTAIHFAAFKGNVKIIKLLIENGANIYAETKRHLNIFHYSAQGNKPTSLMYFYLYKYIFGKPKDEKIIELIKAQDSGGSTPLHWAAYSNAEDVLLYLINLHIFPNENERLAFINQRDKQGFTALHLSVTSKSIRIVMKLLQHGANSEIADKKGNTPLKLAIDKNQKAIADIIRNNQSCELCNMKAPVKQIKKSIKNILGVFISQIVTTFIIFIAILSIAFNTSENDKNVFYDTFFIIYIFFLILFFILYIGLLIKNPGDIKSQGFAFLKRLVDKGEDLNNYCYECFVKKTKDSKHCIICHKCYENFDHHCYWINKCVAKNNYCLFLFFLVETFLYLLVVLTISILGIIHLIQGNNGEIYIYNSLNKIVFKSDILWHNNVYYFILNNVLILMDLFFLIPETLLLILHLHIYTSNYRANKNRISLIESNNNTASNSMETALMREDTNSYSSSA